MNNLKNYKNLVTNFNLIDFAVPIIEFLLPIKYSPNQKYDNRYYITCIIDFINTGTSWNKYKGTIDHPIDGKYLNQIHNKFVKANVYEEINKQLLQKYLQKGKETKLRYQIIDSSFISNKGGSINKNNYLLSDQVKEKNRMIRKTNKKSSKKHKRREESFIDFNKYNGRKKYFKISALTDSFGTPLTTSIISSKQSDNISLRETINKLPINLNTLRNSKNNRYKQYLLADSGYNSNSNKAYLKQLGYTSIIAYNKRNCKDKKIIEQNKLKGKERTIYKKRIIVESFFSWIKNFAVINQNYQKTITSYNGLLSLASSIMISKRV